MILGTFEKQPADVKDYDIDYSAWLTAGDVISTATVVVDSPELKVDSFFTNSTKVKIWLSGGVTNQRYKLTVTVDTDDGRRLQHEFVIKVKDR